MTEQPNTGGLPTQGRMEQAIREALEELEIIDTVRFGETLMRHLLPVHREELAAAVRAKGYTDFMDIYRDYSRFDAKTFAEVHGSDIADALARHDQELTERVLESAIDVGYKAIADCHGVEGINATLQTFVSRLRALKAGPR